MPLTGEAKREYNRKHYQARVKASRPIREQIAQATDSLLREGLDIRKPGKPRKFADEILDAARSGLRTVCDKHGLNADRIVSKIVQRLESRRYFNGVEEKEGRRVRVTITADDGDVQMRAVDAGIGVLERAGTIPSASPQAGSASLTVIEINYHAHSDHEPMQVVDSVVLPAGVSPYSDTGTGGEGADQ